MNADNTAFVISDAVKQEIDHWCSKYPVEHRQSALIPALLLVQKQNDAWLSEAAMDALAAYLKIPNVAVYEVATFYDLYHLSPIGQHKISVCHNIACFLRGSADILTCLEKKLGIRVNETTSDGVFTLKAVECLGACGGAPMCQVDDQIYYEHMTTEKTIALVDRLAEDKPS